MKIVGIDPGLSGAIALYDPIAGTLDVRDMPTLVLPKAGKGKRTELDLYGIANIFEEWGPPETITKAFVEQVGPTPQMGVTSSFSFGGSFWAARMACAALLIPTETVVPQVWKRALQVKGGAGAAKGGSAGKSDAVRARASALLPAHSNKWLRAKDEGRAEAAMIALYGARSLERIAA